MLTKTGTLVLKVPVFIQLMTRRICSCHRFLPRILLTSLRRQPLLIPRRVLRPKNVIEGADARIIIQRPSWDDEGGARFVYVGGGGSAFGAEAGGEAFGFGQFEARAFLFSRDPRNGIWAGEDVRGVGCAGLFAAAVAVAHVEALKWSGERELNITAEAAAVDLVCHGWVSFGVYLAKY